ncbi:unnamed protein product [Boreogadus saida]
MKQGDRSLPPVTAISRLFLKILNSLLQAVNEACWDPRRVHGGGVLWSRPFAVATAAAPLPSARKRPFHG